MWSANSLNSKTRFSFSEIRLILRALSLTESINACLKSVGRKTVLSAKRVGYFTLGFALKESSTLSVNSNKDFCPNKYS